MFTTNHLLIKLLSILLFIVLIVPSWAIILKTHNVCPHDFFDCGDNSCLYVRFLCDGEADCKNGMDEKDCPKCLPGRVVCSNSTECVFEEWLCNGVRECASGSDELNCPDCPEDTCVSDRSCLPYIQRCDGRRDCTDGSDEWHCADGLPLESSKGRVANGGHSTRYVQGYLLSLIAALSKLVM